jgi:hypothetical protein
VLRVTFDAISLYDDSTVKSIRGNRYSSRLKERGGYLT